MGVLVFVLGLISIVGGNASPSKELHWVSSVFAGIVMCKYREKLLGYPFFGSFLLKLEILPTKTAFMIVNEVYKVTGTVSPLFFKGYTKLTKAQKVEWNNRGFSTFHALVVAVASLYFLLGSNLFEEDSQAELIINRTSRSSDTILGVSIGYFVSDLVMILWTYPALGGLEYVLHHGLSMFSIIQALIIGQGQIYIFMVLFTESTTPFVNLRWYLDVAGKKSSKLYTLNGIALFLGWLVARIVLFGYLLYHMFTHFDQVKLVYSLGFYTMVTAPMILGMMNLFWFYKIAKGMVKTLSRARSHSHTS